MPHSPVRHRTRRLATALAVIAGVLAFAPVQHAAAEAAPPALTMNTPSPAVWGPSVPLDLTVTSPATTDVYIELHVSPTLHISDADGNLLPTQQLGQFEDVVTVGKADSDHNGTAGAPLPIGTVIHLRVSAEYPVPSPSIDALMRYGADDSYVPGVGTSVVPVVGEAALTGTFLGEDGKWHPTDSLPLTAGASAPRIQDEITRMPFSPRPASTHLRLYFSADALANGNYTARQLSALKVRYTANRAATSHTWVNTTWTLGADGSAQIDFPKQDWTSTTSQRDEGLSFDAPWGMAYGYPTGQLQVIGDDGHQYGGADEPITISNDYRPASLQAAFYARNKAGQLWQFRGSSYVYSGRVYDGPTLIGGGWNTYESMIPLTPLKADGTGTMVARDTAGVLWLYRGTGKAAAPFAPRIRIGGGWTIFTTMTGVGDITGDGRPDMIARDRAGVLWLYRGTGSTTAPFAPRTRIGGGWGIFNVLTGGSDLTGDGRADLLARDAAGGLWLYRGTGSTAAPFAPRVRVGTGWQAYTRVLSVGDLLADGPADVLATDAKGTLWYYPGTGKAAAPLGARQSIATGWTAYTAMF